jgi:hypothetical protein
LAAYYALILLPLARLAPLRLVLQPLVCEEELFTSSEHELFAAVDTSQHLVRKLKHCGPPVTQPF